MTKRMLIDATHAEETRVVVLDGNRLEDFDVETSTKRQLKGNIYLAKVVRVEPSLQAAFVEYGGNRHGFLAFSEIHPDYYQIPVADRQRLLDMEAEEARREEEEDDLEIALSQAVAGEVEPTPKPVPDLAAGLAPVPVPPEEASAALSAEGWALPSLPNLLASEPVAEVALEAPVTAAEPPAEPWASPEMPALAAAETAPADEATSAAEAPPVEATLEAAPTTLSEEWAKPHTPNLVADPQSPNAQALSMPVDRFVATDSASSGDDGDDDDTYEPDDDQIELLPPPETIGGRGENEKEDDHRERRPPPRFMRNYKIQEVIRRRQIMLVQVVKEERGTKGAALTTYLSLAGRFGVLMPNSPRGGGISRKITSASDRRRLKEVMQELDIPRGMGLIIRTAGASRPKPEIKRDCEYLLRLWDDIREQTLKSVAPALIYEEASLIKRAIRDVYSRDIDEIQVDGEEGWRAAHDFMRMLMPAHAKKVQLWRDGGQPLFARHQVEAQLDAMLMPTVQLKSGGYLVINQAEALVAIDVNSGRSTRERNIEETALRTNLEAADEVARQLRLRDLAGLIVIDFIDMESKRHNAMVEKRIKEALKNDRARIQVGHISHFGLLEMSRQRLRPSLAETSFIPCPHCGGTGHVRSTENAAIHVLRGIEDEGSKRRAAEIVVSVSTPVALYLLNHKRERLREIELRYSMRIIIAADDTQIAPQYKIDRVRTRLPEEAPPVVTVERPMPAIADVAEEEEEDDVDTILAEDDEDETPGQATTETTEEAERRRKRRRRRRRGRRDDQRDDGGDETTGEGSGESSEGGAEDAAEPVAREEAEPRRVEEPETAQEVTAEAEQAASEETGETAQSTDEDGRNRRRGRRGGRRRRREGDAELSPFAVPGAEQPEVAPVYTGPTPADPFGGRVFDIFDMMDEAERAAESRKPAMTAEIVNESAPEPASGGVEPVSKPVTGQEEAPKPAAVELAVVEAVVTETAETMSTEPVVAAETAPEIVNAGAVEPSAETSVGGIDSEAEPAPQATAAEPAAEIVTQEPPAPEPAVKPIVIGADAPVEKKTGWWRR